LFTVVFLLICGDRSAQVQINTHGAVNMKLAPQNKQKELLQKLLNSRSLHVIS